jgi:DNA invertase Pin-like site-specific DNA recombinase
LAKSSVDLTGNFPRDSELFRPSLDAIEAAPWPRHLIRTRTAEGRNRAKAQGKQMGRPPSLTPVPQKEATRRRAQGDTLRELADSYDRSISTMRRVTRAA